jgi:hypothetical protein
LYAPLGAVVVGIVDHHGSAVVVVVRRSSVSWTEDGDVNIIDLQHLIVAQKTIGL